MLPAVVLVIGIIGCVGLVSVLWVFLWQKALNVNNRDESNEQDLEFLGEGRPLLPQRTVASPFRNLRREFDWEDDTNNEIEEKALEPPPRKVPQTVNQSVAPHGPSKAPTWQTSANALQGSPHQFARGTNLNISPPRRLPYEMVPPIRTKKSEERRLTNPEVELLQERTNGSIAATIPSAGDIPEIEALQGPNSARRSSLNASSMSGIPEIEPLQGHALTMIPKRRTSNLAVNSQILNLNDEVVLVNSDTVRPTKVVQEFDGSVFGDDLIQNGSVSSVNSSTPPLVIEVNTPEQLPGVEDSKSNVPVAELLNGTRENSDGVDDNSLEEQVPKFELHRLVTPSALMEETHLLTRATEPDDQMKALADAFKAIRGGLGNAQRARRRFEKEPEFEEDLEFQPQAPMPSQHPADFVLVGLQGITCELTKHRLNGSRVIRLVKLRECKVTLAKDIGSLVKLFIEECVDTTVTVECKILTEHLEIVRCERLHVNVRIKTETLQVDLSKDVKIICDRDSCRRVYHAGVEQLQICSEDASTCTVHDYRFPEDIVLTRISPAAQYLTEINDGELKTKRVKYLQNSLVPDSDNDAENAGIGKCDL